VNPEIRYLTDADVERLVTLDQATTAVHQALSAAPDAAPVSMAKALGTWPGGSLHALGAHWRQAGYAGVKTWINTSAGAESVYCLFDSSAGSLAGFLQARVLGRLRTAAVSAVGLKAMAPPDADTVAVLGTGRQARTQLAAALAVLPLKHVRVWSPTADHRTSFSAEMTAEFGLDVRPVDSVAQAVRDVPVIITVTRASEPFLHAPQLPGNVHINAMGAILPGRAELSPDILHAATSIVVDDVTSALVTSAELRTLLEADPGARSRIAPLADLLRHPAAASRGITVFKSVGLGACDLAIAACAYDAARAETPGRATSAAPTAPPQEEK
jgi:alanine dehydrogenase